MHGGAAVQLKMCYLGKRERAELNCTVCETRKQKRFCPALHERICATCCGTHREVVLDCPSDCSYLKQSREYGRFRPELLEDERWFAQVQVEEDFLDAHAIVLEDLAESISQSALANTSLRDRDVIEALAALVRSFETRANSGLHYEPTRPSLVQQALIQELREVIADYDQEGQETGDPHLHDSDALKALVFVLRLALDRSSGRPLSRGFLDFLRTEFTAGENNTSPASSCPKSQLAATASFSAAPNLTVPQLWFLRVFALGEKHAQWTLRSTKLSPMWVHLVPNTSQNHHV